MIGTNFIAVEMYREDAHGSKAYVTTDKTGVSHHLSVESGPIGVPEELAKRMVTDHPEFIRFADPKRDEAIAAVRASNDAALNAVLAAHGGDSQAILNAAKAKLEKAQEEFKAASALVENVKEAKEQQTVKATKHRSMSQTAGNK